MALWSGYLVLENLQLKADLFDYLKVPLKLSYGTIGRLEIRIPWSNLGNEPAVVVVDRVYLLAEPKYEWDAGAHVRREQAIKQAKLAAAELFATRRLVGDAKQVSAVSVRQCCASMLFLCLCLYGAALVPLSPCMLF